MFLYFTIDGVNCYCNKNGNPQRNRKNARKLRKKEAETEKDHVQRVKASGIPVNKTEAYKWLQQKLRTVVRSDIASIAMLVSSCFDIELTREEYRRTETLLYWYYRHWDKLKNIFSTHQITGMHRTKGFINLSCTLRLPPVVIIIPQN